MENALDPYRRLIQKILTERAELENHARSQNWTDTTSNEETVVVFDVQNDIYVLHRMGWYGIDRVWDTAIFVRLHDGKFWIEEDWTEEGVATYLLEAGVPHEHIVLAFHHPRTRARSAFAVA